MLRASTARLTLALAAVLLAGCDRYVETPDEPGGVPAPAPAVAPTMYVKGPITLLPATQFEFRAEAVPGAVRYAWSVTGRGSAVVDSRGNTRFATIEGVEPGPVVLTVVALGADEAVLARRTRDLTVAG